MVPGGSGFRCSPLCELLKAELAAILGVTPPIGLRARFLRPPHRHREGLALAPGHVHSVAPRFSVGLRFFRNGTSVMCNVSTELDDAPTEARVVRLRPKYSRTGGFESACGQASGRRRVSEQAAPAGRQGIEAAAGGARHFAHLLPWVMIRNYFFCVSLVQRVACLAHCPQLFFAQQGCISAGRGQRLRCPKERPARALVSRPPIAPILHTILPILSPTSSPRTTEGPNQAHFGDASQRVQSAPSGRTLSFAQGPGLFLIGGWGSEAFADPPAGKSCSMFVWSERGCACRLGRAALATDPGLPSAPSVVLVGSRWGLGGVPVVICVLRPPDGPWMAPRSVQVVFLIVAFSGRRTKSW